MEYKKYGRCMFLDDNIFTLFHSISGIRITVSYANKFVFVTTITRKIFNFYTLYLIWFKGNDAYFHELPKKNQASATSLN